MKKHFDESKHERYPEGDPRGGKFAPKSSLSSSLRERIASGALDIPKDIKKRKYKTTDHDPKMNEYADAVWEELKTEMKARGLSDEEIKSIEHGFYTLLSNNSQPAAKAVTAALLIEGGMPPEEAIAMMKKEVMSRGGYYGALVDYKENYNPNNLDTDSFIASEAGFAFYQKYDPFHPKGMTYEDYNAEMGRRQYEYNNIAGKLNNLNEVGAEVYKEFDNLKNKNYVEGVSMVSEVSQLLYKRNAESDTYYRGIYDLYGSGRSAAFDYEQFSGASPEWPAKSIANAFSDPNVTSVEIPGDVLVAWAPSKQIAKTFSAGGGRQGSDIAGKAILQTLISPSEVAFYWPAIYANIGLSVDTKEVWVINSDGTYEISREQWEQLK